MSHAYGQLWSRLADLPLTIEQIDLEQRRIDIGRERITTIVVLQGAGETGLGEDVAYAPEEHAADRIPVPDLTGTWTLADYCGAVGALDLFPGGDPEVPAYRNYRRWAWESAALDLALRQAGTDIATQLGRTARPVNFVSSARVQEPGGEPSLDRIAALIEAVPNLRFKLDADNTWTPEFLEQLRALDRVDSIDFKGHYSGTVVDVDITPQQTLEIARALPEATCEDVAPGEATDLLAAAMPERLAWDAPIHDWSDIEALPIKPQQMNIKPSRIGSLQELLSIYERLSAAGCQMYGGGQFELGVGRGQIILLASLFHPETANDVAPAVFHAPAPGTELPSAPLAVPASITGFRWPGSD